MFHKWNLQKHRITFSCHLMSSAFCLFTLPPPIRTNVLNCSVKNSDGQCNYSFLSSPHAGVTNMWCTLMWMWNERKYWCTKTVRQFWNRVLCSIKWLPLVWILKYKLAKPLHAQRYITTNSNFKYIVSICIHAHLLHLAHACTSKLIYK